MNSDSSRPSFLIRHPWLFVIVAFALLLGAWSSLIAVAVRNRPALVEPQR
ncbi:MAG: hypothetical protein QM755_21630 [Luteolibacter sp.]